MLNNAERGPHYELGIQDATIKKLRRELATIKAAVVAQANDAKMIAELNVAIADRNLEIEGYMKVIAALREELHEAKIAGTNAALELAARDLSE